MKYFYTVEFVLLLTDLSTFSTPANHKYVMMTAEGVTPDDRRAKSFLGRAGKVLAELIPEMTEVHQRDLERFHCVVTVRHSASRTKPF